MRAANRTRRPASPESCAAACEQLRREAARLGAALSPQQQNQFAQYLDLLLAWNERINLTAITSPDEIVIKHFIDSLALVPFVGPSGRVVDVGSGAGLPGIPLAIALPTHRFILLEPTGKKAAFLRKVSTALALPIEVQDFRLEAFLKRPFDPFDRAVSRATFPPSEWLERAAPLVHSRGLILVMTGRKELPSETDSILLDRSVRYTLPDGEIRHVGLFHVKRSL